MNGSAPSATATAPQATIFNSLLNVCSVYGYKITLSILQSQVKMQYRWDKTIKVAKIKDFR